MEILVMFFSKKNFSFENHLLITAESLRQWRRIRGIRQRGYNYGRGYFISGV